MSTSCKDKWACKADVSFRPGRPPLQDVTSNLGNRPVDVANDPKRPRLDAPYDHLAGVNPTT